MVTVIRDLNYLPICRNRNKAEEDNLSQCEKLTYSQHVKLHEVKMKAITLYLENTETNRNLPESFCCYVNDEMFKTLMKHNEEKGCLIELENGSQVYCDADGMGPDNHTDLSKIENEDSLLCVGSYALCLKDKIFQESNAVNNNVYCSVHPIEVSDQDNRIYFNSPSGLKGISLPLDFNAERFSEEFLPLITRNCFDHVSDQIRMKSFNLHKQADNKEIYSSYLDDIEFFTDYRKTFFNERIEDIFGEQDLESLFKYIDVPDGISEEKLAQIYYSLDRTSKESLHYDEVDFSNFDIKLMGNFTFNVSKDGQEPYNFLPIELVQIGCYVNNLNYSYNSIESSIKQNVMNEELAEQYQNILNSCYDSMLNLEDISKHLDKEQRIYSDVAQELQNFFDVHVQENGLDLLVQDFDEEFSISR